VFISVFGGGASRRCDPTSDPTSNPTSNGHTRWRVLRRRRSRGDIGKKIFRNAGKCRIVEVPQTAIHGSRVKRSKRRGGLYTLHRNPVKSPILNGITDNRRNVIQIERASGNIVSFYDKDSIKAGINP